MSQFLKGKGTGDFFFFKMLFLEEGRKKEEENHQCVVASSAPPIGYLAHNLGMCTDWESNQRPFGSQPVLNPLSHSSQVWWFLRPVRKRDFGRLSLWYGGNRHLNDRCWSSPNGLESSPTMNKRSQCVSKQRVLSPGWCGSIGHHPANKGYRFTSLSGHMPSLWVWAPAGVCMGDRKLILLFPFPHLSKINRHNLEWGLKIRKGVLDWTVEKHFALGNNRPREE